MLLSKYGVLSDAQAITTTAVSTNVIDCLVANAKIGDGGSLFLNARVNEAFSGGTSLALALQSSASESSGYVTKITTPAIVTASLTAGATVISIGLPMDLLRYLRCNYTVVGTYTAGKLDVWIADQPLPTAP